MILLVLGVVVVGVVVVVVVDVVVDVVVVVREQIISIGVAVLKQATMTPNTTLSVKPTRRKYLLAELIFSKYILKFFIK